jgi:SAM-dependent methyltransferase
VFTKSAAFYDAVYGKKDYAGEARQVHELIQRHKRSDGNTLLDVACGTGRHLPYLREHYAVEGLDLDANLLAIACERNPGVLFHEDDMVSFDLGRQFDAVVCLFSAIAYAGTVERLRQAVASMSRHLRPGGVLLIEPFFTPDTFYPDTVHAVFVDQPELKIARISVSRVEGRLAPLEFEYLVGTPEGVTHFTERHETALFTVEEQLDAFRDAGLAVTHDPQGLTGRGLYIGTRPLV